MAKQIGSWIYVYAPNVPAETPCCGKWMLFPSPRNIDRYWQLIADATEAGKLGIAAKTAAPQERELHLAHHGKNTLLIAVYTADAEDHADKMRVREGLRELGFTGNLPYKTDADTEAGIYSRNNGDPGGPCPACGGDTVFQTVTFVCHACRLTVEDALMMRRRARDAGVDPAIYEILTRPGPGRSH